MCYSKTTTREQVTSQYTSVSSFVKWGCSTRWSSRVLSRAHIFCHKISFEWSIVFDCVCNISGQFSLLRVTLFFHFSCQTTSSVSNGWALKCLLETTGKTWAGCKSLEGKSESIPLFFSYPASFPPSLSPTQPLAYRFSTNIPWRKRIESQTLAVLQAEHSACLERKLPRIRVNL